MKKIIKKPKSEGSSRIARPKRGGMQTTLVSIFLDSIDINLIIKLA